MRRRAPLALTLALVLFAAGPARGTQGTCTVTNAISSNNLDLPFRIPVANGLAMPVEFDAASGTFSMKRDAWSTQFGPSGAQFDTGFGPSGFLIMSAGTVSGTIDAGGNVTLPKFAMAFATDFCPPRSPDYPIVPDLETGTQFRFVPGQQVFALEGVALDFTTGTLTLEGQDIIPSACGAPGAILSGLRLTCTLAPIPDRSQLPPPPTLTKPAGKAKIGKPLPSTPPKKPDKGDTLTLKIRLAGWPTLDLAGEDTYARVANGDGDLVVLRVPAGKFGTRGKKSQVRDTDGSAIQVLTGHKQSAGFGGTITLATAKGGATLKLRVQGLDLGRLSGAASLTIAIGPHSATAAVTATGSGKSRRLR